MAPDSAESPGGQVIWPIRSGLVPPLADGFISRPESASGLGQALAAGSTIALAPARSSTPGAPDWFGSCGKTQLASYLAESLWKSGDLDLLVWITASNRAAILTGYVAAAVAAMGIDTAGDADSVAARFVGWLAETERSWMIVLDGVASPWDLDGLWPGGRGGRTLLTIADPAGLDPNLVTVLGIPGFSRREALSYLMDRLTEDRGQRSGAIDLVDHLGGEPLALVQASAVIGTSALSCREYQDVFLRKLDQTARGGQSATAAISWILSVEHTDRLSRLGPVQPMLILASWLDFNRIPGTVFTSPAARSYLTGGQASPEQAWAAVVTLERAGLLTIDPSPAPPVVTMNAAIAAATRSATPAELVDAAVTVAASALLEAWPDDEPKSWLSDSLRSSAIALSNLAGDRLWNRSAYRLAFRLGQSMEDANLTALAAPHWNQVAAASDRFLGPGHPDSLAASDHLATAFLKAGRAAEALPWFQRVLADRATQLGAEHPATIAFEVRLGRALIAAGRAREAATVLDHAYRISEQVHGPSNLDTLDALSALADACQAAGETADSIRLYRRVLSERERVQGQSHPQTLESAQNLGDVYLASRKYKEALAQYKRVVAGSEQALGPVHPATIEARDRLAAAHHSAGRMATALRLYEESCEDSVRILGVDHPDTLARKVHLAHALYAVGRLGDATNMLRDTVDRCERILPPGDPLTVAARESLTNIAGLSAAHASISRPAPASAPAPPQPGPRPRPTPPGLSPGPRPRPAPPAHTPGPPQATCRRHTSSVRPTPAFSRPRTRIRFRPGPAPALAQGRIHFRALADSRPRPSGSAVTEGAGGVLVSSARRRPTPPSAGP
jgi:tetratricopeptide (TPR) repeat protein